MNLKVVSVSALAVIALAACSSTTSSSPSSSPASPSASASASMPSSPASATGDIVAVASGNASTTTLVTALEAAGLVTTLEGPGPYTVFAPTNDAFAALPPGVLDKLVQPANKEALTKILTYHVVPGSVMAADIKDGPVTTVEGQAVTLSTANGVTVNGAKVTTPDMPATNGVIHPIDTLLLPPGFDPATLK